MKIYIRICIVACALFVAACTQPGGSGNVKRYAMVTGIRPEKIDDYKKLHAAVWDGVVRQIRACNIRNYSIYLREIAGQHYLFSYFEYTGDNFEADMEKMVADSTTQRWWKETAPMQLPLPDAAAKGETWSGMEELMFIP